MNKASNNRVHGLKDLYYSISVTGTDFRAINKGKWHKRDEVKQPLSSPCLTS